MINKYLSVLLLALCIGSSVIAQNQNWPRKTINGKEFYIYKVNSAEGFYSIGRTFNITQDEILQHNPEAQHGLKAGQELLIPVQPKKQAPEISDAYFSHTVEPGETLYGVAAMYNTTQEQLLKLNPGCTDLLQVGFVLKVPQKKKSSENDPYIYHTIEPKETLFSVARKYNTTIEAIVAANPGLKIDSFTTGKVIRISPQTLRPEQQEQPAEKEQVKVDKTPIYKAHKVKRKETLFSISKQYNVSVASIIEANPGLRELKNNQIINIPDGEKITETIVQNLQEAAPTVDSTRMLNDIYKKMNAIQKKDVMNIGLMLPFMLNKPNDPKAAVYLEFYEGFLLAVEQLKKEGASFTIYAYDTEDSKATMNTILANPEVKNLDLIIGPDNDVLLKMAADFAQKNNINIVNTFSLKNEEVSHNNRIFHTNIPHPYLYAETTQEFCKMFSDRDIYIVSNKYSSQEKKEFIDALKQEIKRQSLSYKEVTSDELQSEDFQISRSAIFVPTSSDTTSLVELIPGVRRIRESKPELFVSLFGYPEWQTYTDDFIESFYALDTYIFTRFYANPMDNTTRDFYTRFNYWFSKDLIKVSPRFGLLGYDTGMFFLKTLKRYGKNFDAHIENLDAKSIQTDFNFQRINNWGGFINKGIYFVNFRPDFTIHKTEIR